MQVSIPKTNLPNLTSDNFIFFTGVLSSCGRRPALFPGLQVGNFPQIVFPLLRWTARIHSRCLFVAFCLRMPVASVSVTWERRANIAVWASLKDPIYLTPDI